MSCVSIKRKNKTQSHKEQLCDTFEEVCYEWSDKHQPGRGGAHPGTPGQGHLCRGPLRAIKGVDVFSESFREKGMGFKEEEFNVNLPKITFIKAWEEQKGVDVGSRETKKQ